MPTRSESRRTNTVAAAAEETTPLRVRLAVRLSGWSVHGPCVFVRSSRIESAVPFEMIAETFVARFCFLRTLVHDFSRASRQAGDTNRPNESDEKNRSYNYGDGYGSAV